MGKIWLKSVDPNRQCCGCEGKSGPCDSCCLQTVVNTSDTVIPRGSKKDERYYFNKFYSTRFDTWEKTNKKLDFNINSIENPTPYHFNQFSISLNKGQELLVNLNYNLSYFNRPASIFYSESAKILSYGASLSKPFTFSININNEDYVDRIRTESTIPGYTDSFANTSNRVFLDYTNTLEESIFSIPNVTKIQGNEIYCLNKQYVGYTTTNIDTDESSILANYFTRSKILLVSSPYKAVWTINGFYEVTNGTSIKYCDNIAGLSDSPPTLNGEIVSYFIVGYESEDTGEYPLNPQIGDTVNGENNLYIIIYSIKQKFLENNNTKNFTVKITALKSACLSFTLDGSVSLNPSSIFPDSQEIQSMDGFISSSKDIKVLDLKFEET